MNETRNLSRAHARALAGMAVACLAFLLAACSSEYLERYPPAIDYEALELRMQGIRAERRQLAQRRADLFLGAVERQNAARDKLLKLQSESERNRAFARAELVQAQLERFSQYKQEEQAALKEQSTASRYVFEDRVEAIDELRTAQQEADRKRANAARDYFNRQRATINASREAQAQAEAERERARLAALEARQEALRILERARSVAEMKLEAARVQELRRQQVTIARLEKARLDSELRDEAAKRRFFQQQQSSVQQARQERQAIQAEVAPERGTIIREATLRNLFQ